MVKKNMVRERIFLFPQCKVQQGRLPKRAFLKGKICVLHQIDHFWRKNGTSLKIYSECILCSCRWAALFVGRWPIDVFCESEMATCQTRRKKKDRWSISSDIAQPAKTLSSASTRTERRHSYSHMKPGARYQPRHRIRFDFIASAQLDLMMTDCAVFFRDLSE